MNWIQNVDWSILQWMHAHLQCGFLDFIMPKITVLGDLGAVWLTAAAILIITKKYRRYGVMLVIGIAAGFIIGNLGLKPWVARPRPCWLDPSVTMLVPMETDFSFPSGHTLASVIGAAILTAADRRFAFAAIPLAILIAFSRLYLYLHFPSDVLASFCLGLPIAMITLYGFQEAIPSLMQRLKGKDPV